MMQINIRQILEYSNDNIQPSKKYQSFAVEN